MDGWINGWIDGWMDGWMDEWMDGGMDETWARRVATINICLCERNIHVQTS